MLDLDRIRADIPHIKESTFLFSCGCSLPPHQVVEAMMDHLHLEERVGGYEAADREAGRIAGVYASIARLINASADEIALFNNATVAWQMAFYALPFSPGDRILTTVAEYAANYVAYLQIARRTGARISVVPNNAHGELDLQRLEEMIDDTVKVISVTWVPTNGGLVNPVAEIGAIARRHRIPLFVDACQAVGQIAIDVEAAQCDMLSATGRKFLRGPRGTGFLYVRKSLLTTLEPPMIDHFAAPWVERSEYRLRDDARRFETWEKGYAGLLGLGVAADYALDIGMDHIEARCRRLSGRLRDGLRSIPGVTLYDLGRAPSSIVSFNLDGVEADTFVAEARARDIIIGLSRPDSTRIDAEERRLPVIVRAAPHYFNTDEEIDRLLEACEDIGAASARSVARRSMS